MERITKKNEMGDYYYPMCFSKCDGLGSSGKCDNCELVYDACKKLGEGYIGESDIRLYLEDRDDDCGYLDISYETLEKYFEKIA